MKKYYAKRNGVKYAGVTYARGQEIVTKHTIRDIRILNAMVRQGKLTDHPVSDVLPQSHYTPPTPSTDDVTPSTDDVTPSTDDVTPPAPPAPPTQQFELSHKGGGYWQVTQGDIVLSDGVTLKGEQAAKDWANENCA